MDNKELSLDEVFGPQSTEASGQKELSLDEVFGKSQEEPGFVQSVVDTVKGAGKELTENPEQAALAGGSAAAESYGSLKGGEIASHALGKLGVNKAIATGVGMIPGVGKFVKPFVEPALGMIEFAGGAALTHKGIKQGEEALGVSENIQKAQAANPNISTAAGTAVMGGMAAKSVKGYKNMAVNEGVGQAVKTAAGSAVGGAAFPYLDYGTRLGINAAAGEGTVEEIPVPTAEDVKRSARDMALLGGMGYKAPAKGAETKKPVESKTETAAEEQAATPEEEQLIADAIEGKQRSAEANTAAAEGLDQVGMNQSAEALREQVTEDAAKPVTTPEAEEVAAPEEESKPAGPEVTAAAQELADKLGIDVSQIPANKQGKLTKADIQRWVKANPKTTDENPVQAEPATESVAAETPTDSQPVTPEPNAAESAVLPGVQNEEPVAEKPKRTRSKKTKEPESPVGPNLSEEYIDPDTGDLMVWDQAENDGEGGYVPKPISNENQTAPQQLGLSPDQAGEDLAASGEVSPEAEIAAGEPPVVEPKAKRGRKKAVAQELPLEVPSAEESLPVEEPQQPVSDATEPPAALPIEEPVEETPVAGNEVAGSQGDNDVTIEPEPVSSYPGVEKRTSDKLGFGATVGDVSEPLQAFFSRVNAHNNPADNSAPGLIFGKTKADMSRARTSSGFGETRKDHDSTLTRYSHNVDLDWLRTVETLKAAAAKTGAMIFKREGGGKHALYEINIDSPSVEDASAKLGAEGLENAVFEVTGEGKIRAYVLALNPEYHGDITNRLKKIAYENNGTITARKGTGEFISPDPEKHAATLKESLGRLSDNGSAGGRGSDSLRLANALWDLANEAGIKLGDRPTDVLEGPQEKATTESEYIVPLEKQKEADARIPKSRDKEYLRLLTRANNFIDKALGLSHLELAELTKDSGLPEEYLNTLLKKVEEGSLVPWVDSEGRVSYHEKGRGYPEFSGYYKSKDVLKSIVLGRMRVALADALDGAKKARKGKKDAKLVELEAREKELKATKKRTPEEQAELDEIPTKKEELELQRNPWSLPPKKFDDFVQGVLKNAVKSTQNALKKRAAAGLEERSFGEANEPNPLMLDPTGNVAEEILNQNPDRGQEVQNPEDSLASYSDRPSNADELSASGIGRVADFVNDRSKPLEDKLAVLRKLAEFTRANVGGATRDLVSELSDMAKELGKIATPEQKDRGYGMVRDFSLNDILDGKHRTKNGKLRKPDTAEDRTLMRSAEAAEEKLPAENQAAVEQEVARQFGGKIPPKVEVFHDPSTKAYAMLKNGKIRLNSAYVRPEEVRLNIDHEVAHHVWKSDYAKRLFEQLWESLPEETRQEIDDLVQNAGVYSEDVRVEESRVRALEEIRRRVLENEGSRTIWSKLVDFIKKTWRDLTGAEIPHEEYMNDLATMLVEVGRKDFFGGEAEAGGERYRSKPGFITPEMDREYLDLVDRALAAEQNPKMVPADLEAYWAPVREMVQKAAAMAGYTDEVHHLSKFGLNPKDVNAKPESRDAYLLDSLPLSEESKKLIADRISVFGTRQLGRGLYTSRNPNKWKYYIENGLGRVSLKGESVPESVAREVMADPDLLEYFRKLHNSVNKGNPSHIPYDQGDIQRILSSDRTERVKADHIGRIIAGAIDGVIKKAYADKQLDPRSRLAFDPSELSTHEDYLKAVEEIEGGNRTGDIENLDDQEILVRNQNRVKDLSPITRDDNGNVIPLSQRFNRKNSDIRYRSLKSNERYTEKVSQAAENKDLPEDERVINRSQNFTQSFEAAKKWIEAGNPFDSLMRRDVPLSNPEIMDAARIFKNNAKNEINRVDALLATGAKPNARDIRAKNEAVKLVKKADQLVASLKSEGGQTLSHGREKDMFEQATDIQGFIKTLLGKTVDKMVEGKLNVRRMIEGLDELKAKAADATMVAMEADLNRFGIVDPEDRAVLRDIIANPHTTIEDLHSAVASVIPSQNAARARALAEKFQRVTSLVTARLGKQELPSLIHETYNGESVPTHTDEFIKKLSGFLKLGEYDEDQINNALLESLGISGYDAAFIKDIRSDIEKVSKMPEGDMRNTASIKILQKVKTRFYRDVLKNYRNRENWTHIMDMVTSAWQAGVLSGPPTAAVNLFGSAASISVESLAEASGYALKTGDVRYFADVFKGFTDAFMGSKSGRPSASWQEFVSSLKGEGTKYRNRSMQDMAALEHLDPKEFDGALKALAGWGDKLKWVGRAMTALDAVNMTAADEAKQRMAMRFFLSEAKGHEQPEVDRMMQDLFDPDEVVVTDARKQAENEVKIHMAGKSKAEQERWVKRRTQELLSTRKEEILPGINELGHEAAEYFTYNNTARGFLGKVLVSNLGQINQSMKGAKFVFSFMNTLANIMNQTLDYTPYGFVRAKNWTHSQRTMERSDRYAPRMFEEGSPEQYAQIVRASVGTAMIGGLFMLAYKGLLDEEAGKDPYFTITGAGPKDPYDRQQLQDTQGWRPNSVKIGNVWWRYMDFPILGAAFGGIGTLLDSIRYKKDDQTTSEMMWNAAIASTTTILDKNLLQGANNFFQVLRGDSPQAQVASGKKLVGGVVSGYTNPGLARWLRNTFAMDKEGMVTRLDYPQGAGDFFLSMLPFSIGYNTPALNTLGEPIKQPWYSASTWRFTSINNVPPHPVITPIVKAGLMLPNPSKSTQFSYLDPANGTLVKTRMGKHPEIMREFVSRRGIIFKQMLTPEVLVGLSESSKQNTTIAQQQLDRMGQAATNNAVAQIQQEIAQGKLKL